MNGLPTTEAIRASMPWTIAALVWFAAAAAVALWLGQDSHWPKLPLLVAFLCSARSGWIVHQSTKGDKR